MDIKNIESWAKRNFNNAICLMGVIPCLVFIYLLTSRLASMNIFTGDIGYIMIATTTLLILGIIIGRTMLWSVVKRLFEFNEEILHLQKKLVEKNRLAAITETTLALKDQIINPLAVVRGNVDLLEQDFVRTNISEEIKDKLIDIRNNCERIKEVTDKLSSLSKPVVTTIHGKVRMIDPSLSE